MSQRLFYSMFRTEPDVLTVPDVVRLLRVGKNTVYGLIGDGRLQSLRVGKKILVPKACLVAYLTDEKNYQTISQTVTKNQKKVWTSATKCGIFGDARETEGTTKSTEKGA